MVGIALSLFILADVAVFLYPTISDYINSFTQSRVVARYADEVAGLDGLEINSILEAAYEYNRGLLRKGNPFEFTAEETGEYRNQLSTSRGVMGILAIDKIDVRLPIYHGTDEGVLQIGLGHIQGTSLPVGGAGTHSFITGHRGLPSSMLLTDLDKLSEDDTFMLYVLGEILTYRVDKISVVEPWEMSVLKIDPGMDYVTLVTCTPYGINTHRLLVRGRRIPNVANAGWYDIYSEARRPDRLMVISLLLVPVLALLILSTTVWYIVTRKSGVVRL